MLDRPIIPVKGELLPRAHDVFQLIVAEVSTSGYASQSGLVPSSHAAQISLT